MTTDDPFTRFKAKARRLCGFYLRYIGLTALAVIVIGLWSPIMVAAALLTLGLPILMLVLWGRSLDEELGWTDEQEGPW